MRETLQDKDEGFTQLHSLMTIEEIARLRPIWIHAASGEIEYARPLIRELKKKYPETPLLVTYSSPSAKKILGGLDEVDAWAALPWESAAAITDFIEKWKPRVLLFARTDVWPVLADTCHQLGLPSLLFAATFAQNSSRLRGLSLSP
uniref:3-deoxy-D-manno-octulosonic acid transferase n=1 Tax=uncultured Bdellovibrio sp. TaxID=239744 RepID=A0A060BYD4_9BACT|nr:Glycos_transf_N [uncultured Bdellovibrio sp.]